MSLFTMEFLFMQLTSASEFLLFFFFFFLLLQKDQTWQGGISDLPQRILDAELEGIGQAMQRNS